MRGIFSSCALEGHKPGSIPSKDEDQVVENEIPDYVLVVLENYEMKCLIMGREEE
jgi:hypothetical protein